MSAGVRDECGGDEKRVLMECVRKTMGPAPFLVKTYMLVEDPATDEVVSWNGDGTAFVVWQPAEFARDLLPTLFKHSNFSSFVRQLNTYGFRKVATSRWEFSNEMFKKGERDLLCDIRRRKTWSNNLKNKNNNNNNNAQSPKNNNNNNNKDTMMTVDEDQRSSSSSSSSEYSILIDENKQLKEQNEVLSSELSTMKRKCQDLLDLVSMYTANSDDKEEEEGEQPLMLFGVRLHVQQKRKRNRIEIDETSASLFLSQLCK